MKKFLAILSLLLLVGCGSKDEFKYDSQDEKERFLKKIIKTNDEKIFVEYKEILKDLKLKVNENDEKAKAQLEEWKDIQIKVEDEYHIHFLIEE
ncbi:hypothetical protein [Fusobacterium sp.]|uniref:hypothetical protein n=1 Tax=Fusobacterium sp. TaxID=68766 RepID=UPI00262FEF46|nr:hypothetical protein [Fusobacterium sp.]